MKSLKDIQMATVRTILIKPHPNNQITFISIWFLCIMKSTISTSTEFGDHNISKWINNPNNITTTMT